MVKLLGLGLALCMVLSGCGTEKTEESVVQEAVAQTEDELPVPDFNFDFDFENSAGLSYEGSGESAKIGTGYIKYEGVGELAQDGESDMKRNSRARPVRRIVKQDVYGNELPESFYFYRSMLSNNEKKLYDQIYANAVELDPEFEIVSSVTIDRVDQIYQAVRFDNPDLFWMDTSFSYIYDENGYITYMKLDFYDMAQNIEPFKKVFYSCADSILEQAMQFEEDIDKVKYCHDILTHLVSYRLGCNYNQSAYSSLCTGKTVYAGFSAGMQYLMQRLGIYCTVVYGHAYYDGPVDAGLHLWNLLFVNGQYYEMDVTWDNYDTYPNSTPHEYSYKYFNITTNSISNDHVRVEQSVNLPEANGTAYSYSNYYGANPGSDFNDLTYPNPSRSLPHLYPQAASQASSGTSGVQTTQPPATQNPSGEIYTRDEIENMVCEWDDNEWDEMWEFFEETFTNEEIDEIYEMEWDEFIDFMVELVNG